MSIAGLSVSLQPSVYICAASAFPFVAGRFSYRPVFQNLYKISFLHNLASVVQMSMLRGL